MKRPAFLVLAITLVCLVAGACSSGTTTPPPSAVDTAAPVIPTVSVPVTVTITLSVNSVPGDFGSYIVNSHDGKVAPQVTFKPDANGKWSKTITVPTTAFVKLDIARIGATCDIIDTASGTTLVHDENSCIVGS